MTGKKTTDTAAVSAAGKDERGVPLLLVTGMSGAGKSSVLKALEDLGYEAIDNLPFSLLPGLIETVDDGPEYERGHGLAIGIDSRTRAFQTDRFVRHYEALKRAPGFAVSLVFCDCSDEVLHRRFTETRRRHPLAVDRPVLDGILREREVMMPLRDLADVVFDTTTLTIHDLRRLVAGHFSPDARDELTLAIMSFSYRRGLPREADLVFDVRFLANPHYVDELRDKTGWAPEVGAFIASDPQFDDFMARLDALLELLLPRYRQEGKSYLTIAIGCTGGRHRSVYVAEQLAARMRDANHRVRVIHREIGDE